MEQTIVMGCQPMPYPTAPDGVTEVDWADVPFPPTDDDGPVMVLHVIRFDDAEAGAHHADRAWRPTPRPQRSSASRHGVRIAGWFAVEGTIVGDGRAWHQARFNGSRASGRSWRWSPTPPASRRRRTTVRRQSPTPTR